MAKMIDILMILESTILGYHFAADKLPGDALCIYAWAYKMAKTHASGTYFPIRARNIPYCTCQHVQYVCACRHKPYGKIPPSSGCNRYSR